MADLTSICFHLLNDFPGKKSHQCSRACTIAHMSNPFLRNIRQKADLYRTFYLNIASESTGQIKMRDIILFYLFLLKKNLNSGTNCSLCKLKLSDIFRCYVNRIIRIG